MKTVTVPSKTKRSRRASVLHDPIDLFHKEDYSHQEIPGSDSQYRVIAPDGHYYTVDLEWNNCTCDSHKYKFNCKHLRAMQAAAHLIDTAVAAQPALYARALRLHQQVISESS